MGQCAGQLPEAKKPFVGAHSMEPRRFFLSRLAGLPLLAMAAADGVQAQVQGQPRKHSRS